MMKMTREDATRMVDELSGLIDMKLNIIGPDAKILACSDEKRVGSYHEASGIIIKEKLDELVVYDENEYRGAYQGTNLPLVIDGEIVGVIGVTGPHEKARVVGKVIKRMAEIMLSSRAENDRKRKEREKMERFLASWVSSSHTRIDRAFIEAGRMLGIDITAPRRIMTISSEDGRNESIFRQVEAFMAEKHPADMVYMSSHSVVLVLSDRFDSEMKALSDEILSLFSEEGIYAGVDGGASSYSEIHAQYEKAKTALSSALRLREERTVFWSELGLEMLLDDIPGESKVRYMEKVWKGASRTEIDRMIRIIDTLYEEDGSIKAASERLGMHPNTLQYQLRKMEEKTGHDPRKLSNAALFGMASLFLRELGEERANQHI